MNKELNWIELTVGETTGYRKFKHTAQCENALHYDNKTTINKQILWRFQKTFFQRSKKWSTPFYLQMFCALSGRSLSWNTLVFSRFTPKEHANFIICHFFHSHMLPHHSKTQLLRYCGTRSFLSKELKSDPDSCPLVWAPCWKFGWRHHISSSGCGPDWSTQINIYCRLRCWYNVLRKRELQWCYYSPSIFLAPLPLEL